MGDALDGDHRGVGRGGLRGLSAIRYGSDVVADLLAALGFRYASLNPGSSFRGLHESMVSRPGGPELVLCPHEKIAVGLAHGFAKASGEPMVALVHDVVGLLHAAMGIYYAYIDRVPVLVLGGAGPMDLARRRPGIDWIHSANVQGSAVRDFTKWDDQPASIASFPDSILRAVRVATAEPAGPVYVALDAALQEEEAPAGLPVPDLDRLARPARMAPDGEALRRVAEILVDAERPVMVPGYAGRDPGAWDRLVELAELLAMGVVDTAIRGNFPNRHPLNVTGSGALETADAVLLVDVKDPGRVTHEVDRDSRASRSRIPPDAAVLEVGFGDMGISAWSHDFGALRTVDVQVVADTMVALPQLVDLCRARLASEEPGRTDARRRRAAELERLHGETWGGWAKEADRVAGDSPVSSARLAAEVWEAVRPHDWVLAGGTASDWALRTWDVDRPYRHPGRSLGAGTQVGISLGVALAHRDAGRLVVSLQPDGDLLFDLGALWVASAHRIPLLVVMCNNRSYENDREHQERMARVRGRPTERAGVGTRLEDPPPDFAAAARALGWHAEGPLQEPDRIGEAILRATGVVVEERRPALVDVVCQPR